MWGYGCQWEILDSCGKTVDNLWKSTGMVDKGPLEVDPGGNDGAKVEKLWKNGGK